MNRARDRKDQFNGRLCKSNYFSEYGVMGKQKLMLALPIT
jgi:hypothetical protein